MPAPPDEGPTAIEHTDPSIRLAPPPANGWRNQTISIPLGMIVAVLAGMVGAGGMGGFQLFQDENIEARILALEKQQTEARHQTDLIHGQLASMDKTLQDIYRIVDHAHPRTP